MSQWNPEKGGGPAPVSGSGGVRGPRMATMTVASQFADYIMRAQELGCIDNGDGTFEVQPEFLKMLGAFHQVLAGGRVEVNVVQSGHPDVVRELERRALAAREEANAINTAGGFYAVMVF